MKTAQDLYFERLDKQPAPVLMKKEYNSEDACLASSLTIESDTQVYRNTAQPFFIPQFSK